MEVSIYERLWKLQAKLNMMVLDGKRDPAKVAELLQAIVDEKVYLRRLFADEVITFGETKVVVHAYGLVKDATFELVFGDLDEKCRDWKDNEEILTFAEQNKGKLGPNANFFKRADGFVAFVARYADGQPYVSSVYELSGGGTWGAEYQHRIFSPKLVVSPQIQDNPKPETVQSYLGLLKHGNTYKLSEKLKS